MTREQYDLYEILTRQAQTARDAYVVAKLNGVTGDDLTRLEERMEWCGAELDGFCQELRK